MAVNGLVQEDKEQFFEEDELKLTQVELFSFFYFMIA